MREGLVTRGVVILASALLIGACGGDGDGAATEAAPTVQAEVTAPAETPGVDDEAAIEMVIRGYLSALAEGNPEACSFLSENALAQLEEQPTWAGSCEATIEGTKAFLSEVDTKKLKNPTITSIAVTGDTATVTGQGIEPVKVVRVDGRWLIAELSL